MSIYLKKDLKVYLSQFSILRRLKHFLWGIKDLFLDRDFTWKNEPSNFLHRRIFPGATLSPWLNDSEFLSLYMKIRNNTLVDLYRCYELWSLAKQSITIEGDIIEVGVWRGGTGALLSSAIKGISNKKVFLADTFSGVVKAGAMDTKYKGGEHSDTSQSIVNDLLKSLSINNVEILKGIFPDETQHAIKGPVSLLHCDVDVYSSAKDIVEWCLPRLSVGGIIIFDDYGFSGCEGVTAFCEELKLKNEDFRFIHNLNGHAVFIKIK